MLRLIVLMALFAAIFALVLWTGFAIIRTVAEETDEEYTSED